MREMGGSRLHTSGDPGLTNGFHPLGWEEKAVSGEVWEKSCPVRAADAKA